MPLLQMWNFLSKVPGGKHLFSIILGLKVPYTGTLRAKVIELSKGSSKVQLRDRWRLRNHLKSIHAIALINLGEVTSGIAVVASLAPGMRGIVTRLEIDYLKKARGTLTATADFDPAIILPNASSDFNVETKIFDESNELVAKVKAFWKVGSSKS